MESGLCCSLLLVICAFTTVQQPRCVYGITLAVNLQCCDVTDVTVQTATCSTGDIKDKDQSLIMSIDMYQSSNNASYLARVSKKSRITRHPGERRTLAVRGWILEKAASLVTVASIQSTSFDIRYDDVKCRYNYHEANGDVTTDACTGSTAAKQLKCALQEQASRVAGDLVRLDTDQKIISFSLTEETMGSLEFYSSPAESSKNSTLFLWLRSTSGMVLTLVTPRESQLAVIAMRSQCHGNQDSAISSPPSVHVWLPGIIVVSVVVCVAALSAFMVYRHRKNKRRQSGEAGVRPAGRDTTQYVTVAGEDVTQRATTAVETEGNEGDKERDPLQISEELNIHIHENSLNDERNGTVVDSPL